MSKTHPPVAHHQAHRRMLQKDGGALSVERLEHKFRNSASKQQQEGLSGSILRYPCNLHNCLRKNVFSSTKANLQFKPGSQSCHSHCMNPKPSLLLECFKSMCAVKPISSYCAFTVLIPLSFLCGFIKWSWVKFAFIIILPENPNPLL